MALVRESGVLRQALRLEVEPVTMRAHARKYDYVALEREFIAGTMSVRELCRMHDIKTWSTVNEQARRNNWERRRADFQDLVRDKALVAMAERRAAKVEEMYDDTLRIIHAGMFRFFERLDDKVVTGPDGNQYLLPGITVDANDLSKLIDRFQLLRGQPTKREAHLGLSLDLNDPSSLPLELLRELQNAARDAGAGTTGMGSSPLPLVTGPRKVN
jgi:hypothetical protein